MKMDSFPKSLRTGTLLKKQARKGIRLLMMVIGIRIHSELQENPIKVGPGRMIRDQFIAELAQGSLLHKAGVML